MSHLAYILPFGIWPVNTIVLHGYMQQIDQNLFKCLNADDGGTWAPSAVITIGGQGISMTGPFATSGTFDIHSAHPTFYSPTGFASDITVGGVGTFLDALTVEGVFTALTVSVFDGFANFAAGGTLGTSFADTWTVKATASFITEPVFQAGLQSNATLSSLGDLVFGSSGSVVERVVQGAGANGTYSVSTADVVYVPSSIAVGSYTYTLDHVGAVAGKKMRICLGTGMSATTDIDLLDITAGRIPGSAHMGNAASKYTCVDVQYITGSWKMTGFSGPF